VFTALHRGGSGSPLLCLHGILDTWRTWELVLPTLERRHEVIAPTLPGHAGGPPLPAPPSTARVVDLLEELLDDAGWETAHLVGNSLGGYLALRLAERGRARSVVALAPGGGWAERDESHRAMLAGHLEVQRALRENVPPAAFVGTDEGRRRATRLISVAYEHIPDELLLHLLRGIVECHGAEALVAIALEEGWKVDPELIACPVRFVWGSQDALLAWPSAAERYRETFPHADWVVLDEVGHAPQLDRPLETSELILGWTAR
jgi:pimeloyl-ACP methyl ester carboxylesterase